MSLFFKQSLPNPQLWKSFHALINSSCSFGEEEVIAGWLNEKLTCWSVCLPTEWLTSSFANQQTSHMYYRHRFIKANHGGKNSQECQIVRRVIAWIKLVRLHIYICMVSASKSNSSVCSLLVNKSKIVGIYLLYIMVYHNYCSSACFLDKWTRSWTWPWEMPVSIIARE